MVFEFEMFVFRRSDYIERVYHSALGANQYPPKRREHGNNAVILPETIRNYFTELAENYEHVETQ